MQKAWAGRIVASRSCLWNGLTGRQGGTSHHRHVAVMRRLPCSVGSPIINKRGDGWLSTHAHEEPAVASGGGPRAEEDDEAVTATTTPGSGNDATAHAYREDMATSYGTAYSTRSSDEGYGERYGDAVQAVLEKREEKIEMQRGGSAKRIETVDSVVHVEYDTSQGESVAQREVARHSEHHNAFESEKTVDNQTDKMSSGA